ELMSHITAIGTANPPYKFSQSTIADFMIKAMHLNQQESRLLNTVFRASGIDYRHSVIEDYGRSNDFTFFSNASDFEPFPTTSKRLHVFREHIVNLSSAAIENLLKSTPSFDIRSVTHLIVVCCTGMYAPGVDVDLV